MLERSESCSARRRRPQRLRPAIANPVGSGESAHLVLCRLRLALRQICAARVEAFVLGQQLGPVAGEAREEMLTRPGAEVEQVRPHAAGACVACRLDDARELARVVGEARQDRRQADAGTHPGLNELAQGPETLTRRRGAGLRRAPDVIVDRRDRERHRDVRAERRLDEHVHVTDDQRSARDDRERLTEVAQDLDACAREPVAALCRLVGIRGSPDRDPLVARAGALELAPEHLGDVRLHPDRGAVAVVGGAVGTLLEPAHVAERAPVHAAHVGVERPLEGHALDAVERHLAGLLAVRDAHPMIIRTPVRSVQAAAILRALICVDDDLPPSTRAPDGRQLL